jgi:hypothetical protein
MVAEACTAYTADTACTASFMLAEAVSGCLYQVKHVAALTEAGW